MTKDLTVGSPLPVIFLFSLPVIGGNLFQLFYTLADTIIVGQTIGADALSAVGATTVFTYFILCFIQGFTNGFSILLAQLVGLKRIDEEKRSIASSLILSVIFTAVITVITCAFSSPILRLLQVPEEIREDAYVYMFIILAGTAAPVAYNLISNILRALGDSRTPLVFLIFSSVLNIVLDIVFIVPFSMGVAGAALATVLSQFLAALICTLVAIKNYDVMRISLSYFHVDGKTLISHFKLGFVMGFQMSVMCVGQLVMQSAVNMLGTSAIAGYTAATKVDQLSVLVNNAFGLSVASYVAQNYGANKLDRIKRGVWDSLLLVEITNILMIAVILLIEPFIVDMFVNGAEASVYSYCSDFFLVTLPFYPVLGILMVYRTSVQSIGNAFFPFLACIVELFARCFCSTALAFLGYKMIVFSSPFAWIGADFVVVGAYFHLISKLGKRAEFKS